MKRVVFDTNAYRKFTLNKNYETVRDEIRKINILEEKQDILSIQSIIVLAELLKHLDSKVDPNYENCKLSIVASVFHCGKRIEGHEQIFFLPTWDKILYHELTGSQYDKEEDLHYEQSVLHLSTMIAKNPTDEVIDSQKSALEKNSFNFLETKKGIISALTGNFNETEPQMGFLNSLKHNKSLRKGFLSFLNSEPFEYNLANIFLDGAKVKYNITKDIDENLVIYFRNKYLPVIHLHKILYEKIANGLYIKDEYHKELNTFYDFFIMAGSLLHENCILVTNETQLIKSFQKVGMTKNVMKLDQYLEEIGFSD